MSFGKSLSSLESTECEAAAELTYSAHRKGPGTEGNAAKSGIALDGSVVSDLGDRLCIWAGESPVVQILPRRRLSVFMYIYIYIPQV